MACEIAVAHSEPQKAAAPPPPSDKTEDCGVKPEPQGKPAYLSDHPSNHEKLTFPQDKQAYAEGGFPQDRHDTPKEGAASEQAYPQDTSLFTDHAAFPQDRPIGLSGCPDTASHTHS